MQSQDNIHDSAKANNGQKEKNPKKKQLSFVKKLSERFSVSVRSASLVFVLAAFILAISLFIEDSMVNYGYRSMENASERYILSQQSATDLGIGSDYLTSEVRSFVITGNLTHLQNYFEEAASTQLRDKAVSNLRTLLDGYDNKALGHLSEALNYSNELMEQEYLAMRLVLDTADYDESSLPEVLRTMELTPEQISLSSEEKRALAMDLVYGEVYMDYKAKIKDNTDLCTQELITESNRERIRLDRNMTWLLRLQSILTIILMTVILIFAVFVNGWIRRPLAHMVEQMKAKKFIDPTGAAELRFVTNTYNTIFEENQRTHEHLTYGNQHDELTGLYNRSAYNLMRTDLDMSHNALLLVDVDKFKSINDTYGHDVGDLVLKRVAEVLTYSFRATDLVFRLGGDEFVVIMNNVDSSMSLVVQRKIEQANVMLQKPTNDLPPTSLSVGVAFGDRKNPEGDIFKDADTALYRMKEKGRCGCYIF
ncbi:MAG: GGDEF domain-containing protein [Blautia sp.]|nr:GGDEF domain-containing protein [Blautia sp.]